MSVKDIDGVVRTLENAGIDPEMIGQIRFALDFEATVTSLEARLRGGYQFQEIIMDALKTTMDFYDADSALVISLDMDLLVTKAEFEVHREGFMPVCGTEPLYLTDYTEIMELVHRVASKVEAFPFTEIFTLLAKGTKSYQRLEQIGIQSITTVPYSKRNAGFVAVINPRKYKDRPDENELLQVLSHVTVAEINEMNLMNYQKIIDTVQLPVDCVPHEKSAKIVPRLQTPMTIQVPAGFNILIFNFPHESHGIARINIIRLYVNASGRCRTGQIFFSHPVLCVGIDFQLAPGVSAERFPRQFQARRPG
ncbi:MAG: hypothetical protein LUD82_05800 [Clostridiales bacterium]|nr:hypothetical protein [Clostridiales bacterium]